MYGLLLGTGRKPEECTCVIRTDLILAISAHWPLSGRQIFEDFCALRAQANFHSNLRKSVLTPIERACRCDMVPGSITRTGRGSRTGAPCNKGVGDVGTGPN